MGNRKYGYSITIQEQFSSNFEVFLRNVHFLRRIYLGLTRPQFLRSDNLDRQYFVYKYVNIEKSKKEHVNWRAEEPTLIQTYLLRFS